MCCQAASGLLRGKALGLVDRGQLHSCSTNHLTKGALLLDIRIAFVRALLQTNRYATITPCLEAFRHRCLYCTGSKDGEPLLREHLPKTPQPPRLISAQFGGSDDSASDLDENDSSLPFPKPLVRSAFVATDFDATTFLSSLSNRFQTLEDLQTELRTLSQSLNKELLDLVNDNYQDFLSLGTTLQDGEEKVEDVRVGLLGFQRELGNIRGNVDARRNEAAAMLEEKRKLRHDIKLGRSLLEIAERVEDLSTRLMIGEVARGRTNGATPGDGESLESLSDESEDEGSDADGEISSPVRKLERLVEQYMIVKFLMSRHDATQPFLASQAGSLRQIQTALRLDVEAAIKQVAATRDENSEVSLSSLATLREYLDDEHG